MAGNTEPLTDERLAELDRLHETAIPLTFANAAGHIFNAYPALRQRLLDAEARLAEAERERDAAANEWEAVVAENSTLLAHMPEQINVERSFRRTVTGLAARDAQQRREGVLEGLGMALIILSSSDDPEVAIKQAAQRLREGK